MKQPSRKARKAHDDIMSDRPTVYTIPGTGRKVRIGYVRPYTLECLTRSWAEIEETAVAEDTPATLRYACRHVYQPYREAVLYVLNSYWKIRLFSRFLTWWWSRIRQYSVEQMNGIVREGKKKLLTTLDSYYLSMALTMDTRLDWMRLTAKEAEQFRAELISAAERRSARSTPSSDGQGVSSSDS